MAIRPARVLARILVLPSDCASCQLCWAESRASRREKAFAASVLTGCFSDAGRCMVATRLQRRGKEIAKILGNTDQGLTGPEIGHILHHCKMDYPTPTMTKWKRLYNAFAEAQNKHGLVNHVIMFITRAMNPVNYTSTPQLFAKRRDQLTTVLSFAGMYVREDGKVGRSERATNLDDALKRAGRLHAALVSREVHGDVLQFCRAELLQENYFHAVLEAVKSIASKIRGISGLQSDGAELAQTSFAIPKDGSSPLLAINGLKNDTDRGEQRGFVNLLVGLFGTVRNPLAHNPKIEWPMEENDALDILTMASLIHRKLDRAWKP